MLERYGELILLKMGNSEKRKAIESIFLKLYRLKPGEKKYVFDNDTVKKVTGTNFRNQFDATKFDSSAKLPLEVKNRGYFIAHLGKGKHAFVKGEGFHKLEPIQSEVEWRISESVLESASNSEAQAVSTAFNNGILQDFLFPKEKVKGLIHSARRSKITSTMKVGGENIELNGLQIEQDGIFECPEKKTIVAIEGKNVDNGEFEIRQLFNSMLYYMVNETFKFPRDYIYRFVFIVRNKKQGNDYMSIYEYKFADVQDPNSINFVKNKKYNLTVV